MWFRLLGPLEIRDGRRWVQLGAPKQRVLLAILLLNANRLVTTDQLIGDLWLAATPDNAPSLLHWHVSQLRRLLTRGQTGSAVPRLLTRPSGYQLVVRPGAIDLEQFDALVRAGRRATMEGRLEHAAASLCRALALWRGPALADVSSTSIVQMAAVRLEECRLAVLEERIDAELGLGLHARLVGELAELVNEYPFREHLRAQLMLTLYRSGRQAEALTAYRELRQLLVKELGVEPSQLLQQLQREILTGADLAMAPGQTAARASSGAARATMGLRPPSRSG